MDLGSFPFADVIAQAAREHRKIKLTYKDELRTVEPYSYRESPAGTGTLFYGYHEEAGGIKAFSLAKIQHVELTDETYNPRWTIEIG